MHTDADRAQKHGMDEFISANPCNFDHGSLFELVQRLTLDHRLNDSYSCLVRKDWIKFNCLKVKVNCLMGKFKPLLTLAERENVVALDYWT